MISTCSSRWALEDDEAASAPTDRAPSRAGVAHVEDGRRDGERRRHLLEPPRRLGASLGVGLGTAPLDLLEREARLVREPADDRDRRLVGLGHDDLPREREHELARAGDDDRRPERRADPELRDEQPFAIRGLEDVRDERRAEPFDRLAQARKSSRRRRVPTRSGRGGSIASRSSPSSRTRHRTP